MAGQILTLVTQVSLYFKIMEVTESHSNEMFTCLEVVNENPAKVNMNTHRSRG